MSELQLSWLSAKLSWLSQDCASTTSSTAPDWWRARAWARAGPSSAARPGLISASECDLPSPPQTPSTWSPPHVTHRPDYPGLSCSQQSNIMRDVTVVFSYPDKLCCNTSPENSLNKRIQNKDFISVSLWDYIFLHKRHIVESVSKSLSVQSSILF